MFGAVEEIMTCINRLFQIFGAAEELKESSQYKDIRLFAVALKYSSTPLYDLEAVSEYWSLPNASTYMSWHWKYIHVGLHVAILIFHPLIPSWGYRISEQWSLPNAGMYSELS